MRNYIEEFIRIVFQTKCIYKCIEAQKIHCLGIAMGTEATLIFVTPVRLSNQMQ